MNKTYRFIQILMCLNLGGKTGEAQTLGSCFVVFVVVMNRDDVIPEPL